MAKVPATPKELIAALQSAGEIDNARWEQFDTLYRPVILLFLKQKFGALVAADAEDLAQDIMVKLIDAFKKRLYTDTKGHFRRYLAAMVNNCAVNALRRRQPERWQSLETIDLESLDDPAIGRAYDQLERQWHEALYQRMTQLYFTHFAHDPTDRAIWDAYRHGESSTETAQRLGKTAEAIRQQRKRILTTLQSLAQE